MFNYRKDKNNNIYADGISETGEFYTSRLSDEEVTLIDESEIYSYEDFLTYRKSEQYQTDMNDRKLEIKND